MKKYIIFYCSVLGYDIVRVDAESLSDAISIADVFSHNPALLLLVYVLNIY
uniref:Uncharacterized protein n=1 Tax=Microviridae sp. ctfJJ5 TaxID=2826739 RepID=A0A8S5N0Y7_9VIRU|nr:MAG TPA: hypothetical protein [Microviridae sp. ctfJJ5]